IRKSQIANRNSAVPDVLVAPVEPVRMNVSSCHHSLAWLEAVGVMTGTLIDDRIGIIKVGDDRKHHIICRSVNFGNNRAVAPGHRVTIYSLAGSGTVTKLK